MSYQQFAYLYDQLMEDAPYGEWVSFVKAAISSELPSAKHILDVGCGTGTLPLLLAKEGFEVTGVDLSSDMLTVAREKAEKEKVPLALFQQDMRELEGLGLFDCVTILCDSLNYLLKEDDVHSAFRSAHEHLVAGGLLLIDVHSLHKINDILIGHTFGSNEEEISYIWQCYQGELENSVEHDLSFFLQSNDYLYERYDEIHIQRTFEHRLYAEWLKECGFEVISITGDFLDSPPDEETERVLFIAKKVLQEKKLT
jgi:SAM-dependent methyltransferase